MIKLVVSFLLTWSCQAGAAPSVGSSGTRGGGDLVEWSFYDLAKDILMSLQGTNNPSTEKFASDLARALACLKVEMVPQSFLDLDGREVSAINIPADCKVQLSHRVWHIYLTTEDRARLVIHELLALAYIPDEHYVVSRELAIQFKLSKARYMLKRNFYFTSSGTFIVPEGVFSLRVLAVGGGGGGGGGHMNWGSAGGGGAGGAVRAGIVSVLPGQIIPVMVGSGGLGGLFGRHGAKGGDSEFGSLMTATGGGGGYSGSLMYTEFTARGGSGGGSGGGGGGNGVLGKCSGRGGVAGQSGRDGIASEQGAGGPGQSWDLIGGVIKYINYSPGSAGGCLGSSNTYNGGGGGGGLILDNQTISAFPGIDSGTTHNGVGGGSGTGYGAGGGGGTGPTGYGGNGAPGVVYLEY